MLISLTEYAKRHNVDASTVRHKILAGNLPAQKIGTCWAVEESQPWNDLRYKAIKEGA